MLSIVIYISILLIQTTYQLETIQVALASAVELPCSVGLNNESTNPGKVRLGGTSVYMFEYSLLLLKMDKYCSKRRKIESKFQGVEEKERERERNNDDIMSYTQLVNVYTYSLIVTQHEIFSKNFLYLLFSIV